MKKIIVLLLVAFGLSANAQLYRALFYNPDFASTSSGSVSNIFIATNAITSARYLTMGTGVLLGRSTAGSGAVEGITVGTGLLLSGGTLSASGGGGTNYVFDPNTFIVWSSTNVSPKIQGKWTNIDEQVSYFYQGSVILLSTNYASGSGPSTSLMLGIGAGNGNGGFRGNTAIGQNAGGQWVDGGTQFATAIGYNSGIKLSDYGSTSIGSGALANSTSGQENVAVGQGAGAVITTGGENTIIGGQAAFDSGTSATIKRSIIIGVYANGTGDNIADIGSDTANYGVRLRIHGLNRSYYVIGDGNTNNVTLNTQIPAVVSGVTNYVVDFSNTDYDLYTSTNMFVLQTTNRPTSSTNVLTTTFVLHAAGANVTIGSHAWQSLGNVAFPYVVTNGDSAMLVYRANGPAETNVIVGVNYAH